MFITLNLKGKGKCGLDVDRIIRIEGGNIWTKIYYDGYGSVEIIEVFEMPEEIVNKINKSH